MVRIPTYVPLAHIHKVGNELFVKFVTSRYGFDVMATPLEFDHPHASPVTKYALLLHMSAQVLSLIHI